MANSLRFLILSLLIASSSNAENYHKSNCPEIINKKASALAALIEGNELRFESTTRCAEIEYKFENGEKDNMIVALILSQADEWWHHNMALFYRLPSEETENVILFDFIRVGGRAQDLIDEGVEFSDNEIVLTASRPTLENPSKNGLIHTELHYGIKDGRLIKTREERINKTSQ